MRHYKIECPNCKETIDVSDHTVKVRCDGCKKMFEVNERGKEENVLQNCRTVEGQEIS